MAPVETPSDEPGDEPELTASEILQSLAAGEGGAVPFSAFVESAGSRIHGLALLLLVLPEVPPIPLPSASAILGIPLVMLQRDGLFITAGMAGGAAMTAAAVGAIDVAGSVFSR